MKFWSQQFAATLGRPLGAALHHCPVRLAPIALLLLSLQVGALGAQPGSVHDLPGAQSRSRSLRSELEAALQAKGESYSPRTEHLNELGDPVFVNRLLLEDSPYLLQHAHNPVDWHAWGEDAFDLAKKENKPVFLSIGYSTCHWCHVMERESFDNVEIARLLNQHFVCIKVDREQRPDVDALYMTAVHLTTGRGGWPMSSLLTPAGKPFFGGTYFPPDRFAELLERARDVWSTRRGDVMSSAEEIYLKVREVLAAREASAAVGRGATAAAVSEILRGLDSERGGFGNAPKFPHEPELLLLLHSYTRLLAGEWPGERGEPSEGALPGAASLEADPPLPDPLLAADVKRALEVTLSSMARGGIYDQVGGGFHRYSTDSHWLVPHFEKMLYNQAHLARAYVAAARLLGDRFYERVARQTLDYVLREMTSAEGLFYSATDADSEGPDGESEEGLFFVWTRTQLAAILGPEDAELAAAVYGVTEKGNFEGRNILHLPRSLTEFARDRGLSAEDLLQQIDRIRETLLNARSRRLAPLRDDKVVTAWNGMMITALAEAAIELDEERYRRASVRAAEQLWRRARRSPGRLWRVFLEGRSSIEAVQQDYAYISEAMLSIYDLTRDRVWLDRAQESLDGMIELFWDERAGGFFMSAAGADTMLLVRPRDTADGAIPAGSSVAVRALARFSARARTGLRYRTYAEKTVASFAPTVARRPSALPYLLLGLDELTYGEAGPREYASGGVVKVSAKLERQEGGRVQALAVRMRIQDGWHINAHQTLSDDLVPTEIALAAASSGWRLRDPHYPPARRAFSTALGKEAAIYEGDPEFTAVVSPAEGQSPASPAIALRVRLQACDDTVCLPAEELSIELASGLE